MTKAVVFRTPGHIPLESFTMVGLNSKPNSGNPIGFFGTGLKYAIAVLLREGCRVTVFVGQVEYIFYTQKEDFRGKEFDFVCMRKRRGLIRLKQVKLPFTLEYGKTWEIWQAYRELHSNTLDENGHVDVESPETCSTGVNDTTLIVVEGEKFLQAYYDRYKTFLPDGMRIRNSTDAIQVIDKPSSHIYYRGMRVYDFPDEKQSKFTYNFLSWVTLTEDRTAKYPFMLEKEIAEYLSQSDDKSWIQEVVRSSSDFWEHKLDFRYASTPPAPTFRSVARMPYARSTPFHGYYKSHTPEPVEKPPFSLNQVLHALEDLVNSKRAPTGELLECVKKYLKGEYADRFMTLQPDEEVVF